MLVLNDSLESGFGAEGKDPWGGGVLGIRRQKRAN